MECRQGNRANTAVSPTLCGAFHGGLQGHCHVLCLHCLLPNLDLTKCQGTGEICSLYRGFVISKTSKRRICRKTTKMFVISRYSLHLLIWTTLKKYICASMFHTFYCNFGRAEEYRLLYRGLRFTACLLNRDSTVACSLCSSPSRRHSLVSIHFTHWFLSVGLTGAWR